MALVFFGRSPSPAASGSVPSGLTVLRTSRLAAAALQAPSALGRTKTLAAVGFYQKHKKGCSWEGSSLLQNMNISLELYTHYIGFFLARAQEKVHVLNQGQG